MDNDWGNLKVYQAGRISIVGFAGKSPSSEIDMLDHQKDFMKLIDEYDCEELAIDLTGLKCLPSRFIGLLVKLTKLPGVKVSLYNASPEVSESIKLTKVNKLVHYHEVDASPFEKYKYFKLLIHDDIVIVELDSVNFDLYSCQQLGDDLLTIVESRNFHHLILDFTHVAGFASRMISDIVRLKKAIDHKNGSLKLCALSSNIIEALLVSNLLDDFAIYDDKQLALSY